MSRNPYLILSRVSRTYKYIGEKRLRKLGIMEHQSVESMNRTPLMCIIPAIICASVINQFQPDYFEETI